MVETDDIDMDVPDGTPLTFATPLDLSSKMPEPIFEPVKPQYEPNFYSQDFTGSAEIIRHTTASRQIHRVSQPTQSSAEMSSQINTQSQTQSSQSQSQSTAPTFERQDSHSSDGIFIIRNDGKSKDWSGKTYQINHNRSNIIPTFDIEMPKICDVLLLTSHIGNEKNFTGDFGEYLELAVKQIGLTKQTNQMVDQLKHKVLEVTKRVLYVIEEQVRVFHDLQGAFQDIYDRNKKNNIDFDYKENLEYLEKEYPEAIRRIYRSFNKYFVEIKKLAKKPFATNVQDPFFVHYQKLVLQVFYDWVDFELETMKVLTLKYPDQNLHKNIRLGPANFQRQFLDKQFLDICEKENYLDNADIQKYKEYLAAIERIFKTDSTQNEDSVFKQTPEETTGRDASGEIDSQSSFRLRARKKLVEFDRTIQKKYEKDYGKVQGEGRSMTSTGLENTYQGKQVNFTYDIRKLCGQVNISEYMSLSMI